MIRIVHKLEYRFVVPGKPESFRSPTANAYKQKVRKIASRVFNRPRAEGLDVRLDYFHASGRKMDMDNISKCILDALNGLAYVDDRQVAIQSSSEHDLAGTVHIPGGPVDLVKPLRKYTQYLFVRIRVR